MLSFQYSFSIMMWEILEKGEPPYGDMPNDVVLYQVRQGTLHNLERPKLATLEM